jgi:hypothetical protein
MPWKSHKIFSKTARFSARILSIWRKKQSQMSTIANLRDHPAASLSIDLSDRSSDGIMLSQSITAP